MKLLKINKYAFFTILLLFFYSKVHSQLDLFDIQFPIKSYVEDIFEDKKGYIWINKGKELLRYNSQKFKSANFKELLGGRFKMIKQEEVIIYLDKTSIYSYHLKTNQKQLIGKLKANTSFEFFYIDDAKKVWLFTSNIKNKERNVYKITKNYTLQFAFNLYDNIKDYPFYNYEVEIEDANGNFYIHYLYDSLLIIDEKGNKVELELKNIEDFNAKKAYSVFRLDNKNNLWRICYDAFEIYNPKLKVFEKHSISGKQLVKNRSPKKPGVNLGLKQIFIDSKNRIWLGFEDSNLFLYNKKEDSFLNFKAPLVKVLEGKGGDIKSLIEDKNGNIWGNKRGGIFKIREKENYFKSYLINTDNPKHKLYKVNAKHTKELFSYFGKEFLRTNPCRPQIDKNGDIYSQDQRFSYKINAKNNSLEIIPWFHNKGKQYIFIQDSLKTFTTWSNYYTFDKKLKTKEVKTNVPIRSIENIFIQKNGKIWISGLLQNNNYFLSNSYSLSLSEENFYKNSKGEDAFNNTKINTIVEDDNGNIWLSTYNGLYKINTLLELEKYPEYKYYKNDSIKFTDRFTKLYYTQNNKGWLFNRYKIGFLNLKTNKLEHYTTNKEINLIQIYDILPINNHSIWYASRTGVGYYNFLTKEKKHFDKTHTLIDDFNVKYLTQRPQTGEIIATSTNGLHIFHPDSLIKKQAQKESISKNTQLILNNYSVLYHNKKEEIFTDCINYKPESILLNYNDKLLTINYELVNYDYPKRHRFKTKLEGYDNDWSNSTSQKFIRYNSLPPGNYLLKIKGSFGDGIWSKNQLSIPIKVKQAWFRTWWFYLLILLLLSSITFFLSRYYYHLKLNQQKEIENLRTKISVDLHDDVGSILTGLSMQAEILEHQTKGNYKKNISRISYLSRDAMLRMRDAVWAMDSRKNNWKSLIDRMNEFAAETLELKNIAYQIKYKEEQIHKTLTNLTRQNLYLIYKESITNILKHSNATKVKISIFKDNGSVKMKIKDNGSITKQITSAGLGLTNIKMRAKKINAEVIIKQQKGFSIEIKSKPH